MTKGRIILFVGLLLLTAFISYKLWNKKAPDSTIKIGWQSAWATQGQLAEVLQKTNILSLNGVKGDFKSFTYGAPLSEAALAGELDVAFVGDQPAITLLSKSDDWKIIGRLMDFRVGIVVPANSDIKSIADLKGKTLGIPFGSSTHRVALQLLKEARLEPDKDVKILNIDIQEQNEIVKAGGNKIWKGVDAFASWDHHIANYEKQGWAKVISSNTALGVILMSEKYMKANPEAAVKFLSAFKMAYFYYSQHQNDANKWFANATQGKFDITLLSKVALIEQNLSAKNLSDVHIEITFEDKSLLQTAADFAKHNQLTKSEVKIENSVIDLRDKVDKMVSESSQDKIKVQ